MMTIHNPEKAKIQALFNSISPVYDFLNHLLSFGLDKRWRKMLLRNINPHPSEIILDGACGTGNLTRLLLRQYPKTPFFITGIDLSDRMIHIARHKTNDTRADFMIADLEELPFETETFHHGMVAFGMRNLPDIHHGLDELFRVLKEGGCLYILEFAVPPAGLWHRIFMFYFHRVLPRIGKRISGHPVAYTYLPDSVDRFMTPEKFKKILIIKGFHSVELTSLSGGVCWLYTAKKGKNAIVNGDNSFPLVH